MGSWQVFCFCLAMFNVYSESPTAAPSESSDLGELNSLYAHRSAEVLQEGELKYSLKTIVPERTASELREIAESRNVALKRLFDTARSRGHLGDAAAPTETPEQVAISLTAQERQGEYHYVFHGPEIGGDRCFEFVHLSPTGSRTMPSVLLQRNLGAGRYVNIRSQSHQRFEISNQKRVIGIQSPHSLGRLVGSLAAVKPTNLTISELQISDVPDQDEHFNRLRELKCNIHSSDKSVIRLLVTFAPDAGYVTPMIRESNEKGHLLREWICNEYMVNQSGIWFPTKCRYKGESTKGSGSYRVEEYEFAPADVKLNAGVSSSSLCVFVPRGSFVTDAQTENSVAYAAKCDLSLNLDHIDNLSDLPCLQMRVNPKMEAHGAERRIRSPFLLLFNAMFIAALVVIWCFTHRSTRLLLLILGISSTLGCQNSSQRTTEADLAVLSTPSSVDFGFALTGERISIEIKVNNHYASPIIVQIFPACNCLSLSDQNLTLAPLEEKIVRFELNPSVNAGNFKSEVVFEVPITNLGKTFRYVVPIVGEIRNSWSIHPRRILLRNKGEGSEVKICAPINEWKDVELLNTEYVNLEEIQSSSQGEFLTRQFRVSVRQGYSGHLLTLRRSGYERAFATIPIVCDYEK